MFQALMPATSKLRSSNMVCVCSKTRRPTIANLRLLLATIHATGVQKYAMNLIERMMNLILQKTPERNKVVR